MMDGASEGNLLLRFPIQRNLAIVRSPAIRGGLITESLRRCPQRCLTHQLLDTRMTEVAALLDGLEDSLKTGGREALLNYLIDSVRAAQSPHDLFEALKMQARLNCGLPLVQTGAEELDDETRDQLEDGLLSACREVGEMLIQQGKVRDGWMYLRPVGEKARAAELLGSVEADEDNMEELIEVCLHEGVDAERGFGLVLEYYGTCNSITTMDSVVPHLAPDDQVAAARLLLGHVHEELLTSVRADVGQQEGAEPSEQSLTELVTDRDWLFGEHSYHIDTTHLASTVRYAEVLTDAADLRLALDLTEYGRRLHPQFQYQGDEPFAEIYPMHALFFQAQLGENVDEAIAAFAAKAELDVMDHGTMPLEVFIDLLARLGRYNEAIEAHLRLPNHIPLRGVAPSLLELCQAAGDMTVYLQQSKEANNVVEFAKGLLCQNGE